MRLFSAVTVLAASLLLPGVASASTCLPSCAFALCRGDTQGAIAGRIVSVGPELGDLTIAVEHSSGRATSYPQGHELVVHRVGTKPWYQPGAGIFVLLGNKGEVGEVPLYRHSLDSEDLSFDCEGTAVSAETLSAAVLAKDCESQIAGEDDCGGCSGASGAPTAGTIGLFLGALAFALRFRRTGRCPR